ncbi:MAG: DUF4424 family protein [Deltaproteobacteria bacterium]
MLLKSVFALSLLALPALANDGFGGLTATGLQFSLTDAVAMESEDLYLSIDKIKVAYTFRNLTSADVTGEVIFPLPPISLAGLMESMMNLPENLEQENFLNFTAVVNGQPVTTAIDRIAVIEPPWESRHAASEQYDSPGKDVTSVFDNLGLPLLMDVYKVKDQLAALDAATLQSLIDQGLVEVYPGYDGGADEIVPLWSIVLRYHWTQTFAAGAVTTIAHDYDSRPSGGLFSWETPVPDYMETVRDQYCVDDGTSKALTKLTQQKASDGEVYSMGEAWFIAYVLKTANSWAGPIKSFKLTVDKGDAANIISLCADGIKKTGPTTFVMEKTDYVPSRDLDVLVVKSYKMEE